MAVALARAAQTMPQPPQCATALRVSVSQPLAGSMSQLPAPSAQAITAQRPATHEAVAAGRVQVIPHPPQWAVFTCRSTQPPPQQVWPAGQARVALQPVTHTLPMQSRPAGQCSSVTQSTQVRDVTLQRRVLAPPSPVRTAQPSSLRQPGAQRLELASQCWSAGPRSFVERHCTQLPEAVSQTGPLGSPAQSASARQAEGASAATSAATSKPTSSVTSID